MHPFKSWFPKSYRIRKLRGWGGTSKTPLGGRKSWHWVHIFKVKSLHTAFNVPKVTFTGMPACAFLNNYHNNEEFVSNIGKPFKFCVMKRPAN